MYVCVCQAITDRQIRDAAQRGAHTVPALQLQLPVGACCGRCIDAAQEVLDEHHAASRGGTRDSAAAGRALGRSAPLPA
jgi:bacterioferritin-associated ferredoxin